MAEFVKIVCLANSKKWRGRCVACKVYRKKRCGPWIRPISESQKGEVSLQDMRFENKHTPQLLDIIEIPLKEHAPESYQTENYFIDGTYYWEKVGEFPVSGLPLICDDPDELWINGYSSFNGINDKIPKELVDEEIKNSLLLVEVDDFTILVRSEMYGKKVRGRFYYNGKIYRLVITDPLIESEYLKYEEGEYNIDDGDVYLCVSLATLDDGFCYKLIAGVILG